MQNKKGEILSLNFNVNQQFFTIFQKIFILVGRCSFRLVIPFGVIEKLIKGINLFSSWRYYYQVLFNGITRWTTLFSSNDKIPKFSMMNMVDSFYFQNCWQLVSQLGTRDEETFSFVICYPLGNITKSYNLRVCHYFF